MPEAIVGRTMYGSIETPFDTHGMNYVDVQQIIVGAEEDSCEVGLANIFPEKERNRLSCFKWSPMLYSLLQRYTWTCQITANVNGKEIQFYKHSAKGGWIILHTSNKPMPTSNPKQVESRFAGIVPLANQASSTPAKTTTTYAKPDGWKITIGSEVYYTDSEVLADIAKRRPKIVVLGQYNNTFEKLKETAKPLESI